MESVQDRGKMKVFYIIIVSGLLVVFGMLFFPTIHFMNGLVDTTGFLPLLTMAVTLLPYAFLFFVLYAVFLLIRR